MSQRLQSVPLLAAAMLLPTFLVAQGESPPGDLAQREAELRDQQRQLEDQLQVARAAGLSSVNVNGVELTPQHVRREAIYLVGARMVEEKIADFFIEEWKERAIEEGRDPADFEVSEEQVKKELKSTVDQFRTENPGVEFWEAIRSMFGLSKDAFMEKRRRDTLFNKVFFPGPAKNWPSITKEAIMASAQNDSGQQFWDNIEKSSVDPETGEPRELPAFWMQLCRQWVTKQLKQWSDIRYPSDGLPPDVVLSVNGREWATDDAFEFVRPAVFYQDIQRAMTEVVLREALKQELQKQDSYLSDEEFRRAFDEYRQEYDNTPFTTEVIATAFKGYPSLEAYRQRWRLLRSFENMIAADINDDNLQAYADSHARFFADGQTNVDVIQFMARDLKTGAWLPDGFERAKERAQKAFDDINAGASFDEVLAQRGEYYGNDEQKGRLGSKSLNQLRQALHETEFTDLLMGYSIGNYLFFDADVGKIVGPMRGPDGYYIARVNSRSPAQGAPKVADPRTRELVKQDYVNSRFMEWANGVLQRTEIE